MKKKEQIQNFDRYIGRIIRFANQLTRDRMSGSPTTVQQYCVMEAIEGSPRTMSDLATEVGIHQSTLTRIVEKLEKQDYLVRTRKSDNQRSVEVRITEAGLNLWDYLETENFKMMSGVFELLPVDKQDQVIDSLEIVSSIFSPDNEGFKALFNDCCSAFEEKNKE